MLTRVLRTPLFRIMTHLNALWPLSEQNADLRTILKGFLDDHEMISMDHSSPCATNEELEEYMRNEIELHGLPPSHLNKTLHMVASLIELAYHDCTFEEKKQIALYTWYVIYIDDVSSKDTAPYVAFEQSFLENKPQLNPVLDQLAVVLHAMFHFYPAAFANSIINATFEFISGTCIEPVVEKLHLSNVSTRFPWFFRDRTGVSVAFALMLFPKSRQINYVACFQAMADMDFWISATNDLLSYHKESIDGETANYISNRAVAEGKAPLQVMLDIRRELLQSRDNIYETLANTAGKVTIKIWRTWEHGYITWHLQQNRYKLRELGFWKAEEGKGLRGEEHEQA